MNELEARLIEISKRYGAIDMQISNAYAVEQAKLQLELVLSRERLSSESGMLESLAAINTITELTKAHKKVFQKFILAFSAESSALFNEYPEVENNETLTELVETINWQLNSQMAFYNAREQWIDASTKICNLVQACRKTAVFGETLQFANDEEFDMFEREMTRIENAHYREVSLMAEKTERLSRLLKILGIQVLPI